MAYEVATYGLTGNPPGLHHRTLMKEVSPSFDEVNIFPCGSNRTDGIKGITDYVPSVHRAALIDLAFQGLSANVKINLSDLERGTFTRTHDLENLFRPQYEAAGHKDVRLWNLVGADWIKGGASGQSGIQTQWQHGPEIWNNLNWAVMTRHGIDLDKADLPPHHRLIEVSVHGSSTDIRTIISNGGLFHKELLTPVLSEEVISYIDRYKLYTGAPAPTFVEKFRLSQPKIEVYPDERNEVAKDLALSLRASNPHIVASGGNGIAGISGDGGLLSLIRQQWRRRKPFIGLNRGHKGALLNRIDEVPEDFFSRTFEVLHAALLHVTVTDSQGNIYEQYALNDAWLERASGQMASFELKIDGQVVFSESKGDNLLVSSQIGSTAYWRNMGGQPFPPGSGLLGVYGQGHDRDKHFDPLLIHDNQIVEITGLDTKKRPLRAFVDSVEFPGQAAHMKIRTSRIAAAELMFVPGTIKERTIKIQYPHS